MNSIDHKERDAKKVEEMFSDIAARYDLLNHVLSLGLDIRWRKRVAQETGRCDSIPRKINCQSILDVCTGTGDMAIELCKFWKGNAHIEGIDFSHGLIEIGRKKIKNANLQDKIIFREGDAEKLSYKNEQFDAITITFGLRNINNRLKALKEFYRVTKTGGCFVCLEFSQPKGPIFAKIYSFYLMIIIPFVSKILSSDPAAYKYLGNTIRDFPSPVELVKLIESAGWRDVTHYTLAGGIVAIHRGRKY
ncbi:MAG: bifunctional demethylmenaquinone methyltransferase/2-methoxy-6-polyprenyl-1,4-benzoquinol methylase UbiE [Nitrospirae bacterium CG_4_10_14_0_8_um_filter_41_23]|nr:bifunctional demethylmenaquinone methyltransferase/2-methoxy-6-polyprenyl-1,4-benzoquinol methylase UbiE [Nitrospirota bacterium]OIP61374.1 MAG: bifunctional demethylmenaquinone methyltransferase/2-methoxy-6-polyprenyl-1,4-benzoquinol methylase [Nitrospirae bacterium CG2_30_41_42]PIQ94583.1 MAG: bifunctional demethylmenaquinone methyltransferase/2-methoxy-6-polyprenyl-1,4-benzoquinol methylase UbiE [Nitrospirae bacterium CG11_big_fil_rev_8_21_14_0_20_41_14]PIV41304.1 MAG: bifunctional demethy